MMRMAAVAGSFKGLLAGAAIGAAAAMLMTLGQTDALLARSFEAAFSARAATLSPQPAGPAQTIAGSESFWLSRNEGEMPAGLVKTVAAGDRITIAGADGRQRVLEVTDVHPVGGSVTRSVAPGAARLDLVTARIVGDTHGRVIRFIVNGEEHDAGEGTTAKPNRAL